MNDYGTVSDDFGIYVHLASKVEMPTGRETVLHFFDAVRRHDPKLTDFEKRDGEYVLEEDREADCYRWVSLDGRRLSLGFVNPTDAAELDRQTEWALDAAPFHLGMSGLDADSLDVMYYFDFDYTGNHDEVVAEALATGGPFESLTKSPAGRVLQFQPTVSVALDESCLLQARLAVETRTTGYQVRTGNYAESAISVYFTLRQFWTRQPFPTFAESYRNQRKLLDAMVAEHVVPNVLQPLARTIGARQ
ncbi:MAG: hypothetical protein ACRC7O_15590 [Fimbriiglobus sp.]